MDNQAILDTYTQGADLILASVAYQVRVIQEQADARERSIREEEERSAVENLRNKLGI